MDEIPLPQGLIIKYLQRILFIYNLWVVEDERGIAPEGWHIANEEDWT